MSDFNKCFPIVISFEGGYSNNSADPGGATCFGITEKTARANGYTGDMRNFILADAEKIYKKDYWDTLNLDKEPNLKLALLLFDSAVNCGVSRVQGWLKQIPAPLTDKTKYLMALRGKHYAEICIKNPTLLVFLHGWYTRLVSVMQKGKDLK